MPPKKKGIKPVAPAPSFVPAVGFQDLPSALQGLGAKQVLDGDVIVVHLVEQQWVTLLNVHTMERQRVRNLGEYELMVDEHGAACYISAATDGSEDICITMDELFDKRVYAGGDGTLFFALARDGDKAHSIQRQGGGHFCSSK